jgi:hypothetical protein
MTTAVAGARLSFKAPRKDEVKPGDDLEVVVDVEVPDPWFELPKLGNKIPNVDGRSAGSALAFEGGGEVPAVLAGTATVRDTKIDVHTPAGFPDAGAGRGVEVSIRAGAVEVRYGHLERGSTRSGVVRAGESVGRAGNTGRCVDGCGRRFVLLEVSGGRTCRSIEEFAVPIEVEALLEGKSIGRVRFPEGELKAASLRVAKSRAPREALGKRSFSLEVRVTRGGRPLITEERELAIRH